jgi:protein-tyrosine kinase
MTHVADALRRLNRESTTAEAFTERDHPWGQELDGSANGNRETISSAGNGAQGPSVVDMNAAPALSRRVVDPARDPESARTISPLLNLDLNVRQQVSGLVERVFLPSSGEAPHLVAFAGLDTDAGSAWISAAVAAMLALRTSATICVADVNFANPRLHQCFDISPAPGIVEALDSDIPLSDTARQVQGNVWVLPAGEPTGPVELAAESRVRIARLGSSFDHVILNLEPLAQSGGGRLPTVVDGIVLVIAADATRREAGRRIAERLQASGAAILGAVLTNRRYAIPEAIYKRL